jgi:hypothetical protein
MTADAAPGEAGSLPAILAGNSRIEVLGHSVRVEAQVMAFAAALARANEIATRTGMLPRISIAFDHQGIFRRQFLAPGLTNSQQRNPRLSQLRPEAVEIFAPTAEKWNVPLDSIFVIHEDSARTKIDHLLSVTQLPPAVLRRVVVQSASAGDERQRVSCAAVTSEYFRKAATSRPSFGCVLEVFFEDSPWSRALAYVRGLQVARALGAEYAIQLNLVDSDGTVHHGEYVPPPASHNG